jgi:hypothetical protein
VAAKLVTPDTKVLAGVDADRLKTTPFFQAHADRFAFPGLNATAERLGVDPRRDLSSIVIGWNGQDALAIVQGRFSKAKLEPKLSGGAHRSQFRDFSLYGEPRSTLALLQDGLAVAGTEKAVRQAIDHHEDNHDDVPDELIANLSWLSKSDQVWVVSRGSLPFADVPTRSEYSSLLSNFAGFVKGTALGLSVDTGLHLKGRVECVSPVGAKRVNDALRGGIGLARLSTKDNELDMLKLYDAIHVRQDASTVYVDADLSANEANQLLSLLERLQGRAGGFMQPRQ